MARMADCMLAILVGLLVLAAPAQARQGAPDGPLGTTSQALVGGPAVDMKTQEAYGLLILNGGSCSASLLRNDWVITASHCVDTPDKNEPTGFRLDAQDSATPKRGAGSRPW